MALTPQQRLLVVQVTAAISDDQLTAVQSHIEELRGRILLNRHYLETAEANLADATAALDDAELSLYNLCREAVQSLDDEHVQWH